jgi:hypothetical protein
MVELRGVGRAAIAQQGAQVGDQGSRVFQGKGGLGIKIGSAA